MKSLKLFIIFLSFILVISGSFSGVATAQTKEVSNNKEIEQLAKELESTFKNVNLKEKPDGTVTGDIEQLKKNLPEDLRNNLIEFEKQKKLERKNGTMQRGACPTIKTCDNVGPVSQCVNRNIKNNIVSNLTQDVFSSIWAAIVAGEYLKAAKGLTKVGLKSASLTWASGQIGYYVGRCIINSNFGK